MTVLIDAAIAVGALELRCTSNKVMLNAGVDTQDATTFCSGGWRKRAVSLEDWSAQVDGFYDPAAVDAGGLNVDGQLVAQLGTVQPVSIAVSSADGSVAYLGEAIGSKLDLLGEIGSMAAMTLEIPGSGRLARGVLLHPPATARTASGTGTGRQLTTVATGGQLVAVVNVTGVTGTTPSLTVTLQRDDNAGFSSPVTVGTFGPFTAPGAQILRVAGPITPDDRYRITWAISGTTPSFVFSAAVGIN